MKYALRVLCAYLALVLLPPFVRAAAAADPGGWLPLAVVRFDSVDAIDADDGNLAAFLKGIRNDGRFPPPIRTLVGPAICNPTLFGLTDGAWMEGVALLPSGPGKIETLWVFPVGDRDEYMRQLASGGLTEYGGMDEVTVLRATDVDGVVRNWYMEWLPGALAVFGSGREAVAEAKRIYLENSASRGLLAGAGGQYIEPDIMISFNPHNLAVWQDREPGIYWWRERITKLAADLAAQWRTAPARTRLIESVAADVAGWPRNVDRVTASVWLEEKGVEWRLDATGDFAAPPPLSQLESLRRLPERAAMAYAVPVTGRSYSDMGGIVSRLLLGGAGGVVSADARAAAFSLNSMLAGGGLKQAAAAWVPPPPGKPELGGARMLVSEWDHPEVPGEVWRRLLEVTGAGTPVAQVFQQLGWRVSITRAEDDPDAARIAIYPAGAADRSVPYYNAIWVARRNGNWLALAGGAGRNEPAARRTVTEYRAVLAADAVNLDAAGGPDVRSAFIRMGPRGASFLGYLDPVRFMQLALTEAADWRPRSPDQHEPPSTRLAREMLEFGSAGAWTCAGEADDKGWHFNGGMSWESLTRLAGALGVTESIGMD